MNNNVYYGVQYSFIRVLCTFYFSLFTFFYLFFYQADLLTAMQHTLSHGKTHYDHFIGAVLITIVLLVVQVAVSRLCRQLRLLWALTYLPSALLLAMLTDASLSQSSGQLQFGGMVYAAPVVLALYALLLRIGHVSGFFVSVSQYTSALTRSVWTNVLVMSLLLLSVCLCDNSDKTLHVRLHMEQCLTDGNCDEALATARRYALADPNVTMLSAYALSKKGELGEHLFEYCPTGGAGSLMPDPGRHIMFELYPDSLFYAHLGTRYLQTMPARKYLDYQRRHGRLKGNLVDYQLCARLLDRDLDGFARDISTFYEVNDSAALPRHYREALTLYVHQHSSPILVYKNNVTEVDYQDYQKLEDKYADPKERQTALRDTYGSTYWYYYQYREYYWK